MDTESVWKRLVTAAARPGVVETDRVRRALLSDAMTVGATITDDSVGCSITQSIGDEFRTAVASNSLALDLDSAQYADGDGPCLASCRDGQVHSVTVMEDEPLYPEFTQVALGHGVRSSLSLPLPTVSRSSSLNLYARDTQAFDAPRARAVATLLARCAAVILTGDPFGLNTPLAAAAPDAIADPRQSPDARIVASAVRLLGDEDGLDGPAAFAELTRRSRTEGRGLVAVARGLIAQRTDPGPRA